MKEYKFTEDQVDSLASSVTGFVTVKILLLSMTKSEKDGMKGIIEEVRGMIKTHNEKSK